MPKDPGLTGECVFLEAVAGDGGTHQQGQWWLSPDIQLKGGSTGVPDKADPGFNNPITVQVHVKNNCMFDEPNHRVHIELYAGIPSLVMTPGANTFLITSPAVVLAGVTPGTTTHMVNWNIPAGSADPVLQPGHKCLVMRAWEHGTTPDPADLGKYAPPIDNTDHGDPHYAQHNICIVPCGGPGAANVHDGCGVTVSTTTVHPREPELVTIQSWFDPQPAPHVRDIVLDHLRHEPTFKRLATAPPVRFGQTIPDLADVKVLDNTHKRGCLGLFKGGGGRGAIASPSYNVQAKLEPGRATDVFFKADLSRGSFGDAYIFHMKQVGERGYDQGGLTIVMLVG